jgi:acetolactate synthase I/II/III large subunit
MKASDLLVRCLEEEGVEFVFGIPGEENLDFLDSLRSSKIKLVITRHEQAAGFMAATVGRLTGKAAVALSTLGPGATNFTTAAAYAQLGGMPMVMISGQKPIRSNKQGMFQIVDIVSMMEPLTKFTSQVKYENKIPALVREAFSKAQEERCGATHLELPEDIAAADTNAEVVEVSKTDTPKASDRAIDNIAELIKKAKNPLLLIGAGANREHLCDSFQTFLDKTGMYFFTSQMGKGAVDERSPHFLQTTALSANDYVHCAVNQADLIIAVGHDPIEKPPFIMEEGGPEVIHINYFPARSDDLYFPQHEVIGPICDSMYRLAQKLDGHEGWDMSYFEKLKGSVDELIKQEFENDSFPIIPQRIVADVRKVMPDDGIVALDNGMYKIWFARHYPTYLPNTLLLDNALASMGAGLPSAMAAKLVYPDRKVVAICGDGGFMMNSQEIETAIRLKLDLVVLIVTDNAYGMIKWKQGNMEMEDFGLDFANPDFVKYAESYGAKGHKVEKVEDLEELLRKSLEEGGVHLIDVPIDYSENSKVSAKNLKAMGCIV